VAAPVGSNLPTVTIPPWDGKARLNILLIGTDQRPDQGSYNTDTLIVVSIDPVTKQVAMLSLPRDTVDVPLPRNWRAYGFYGGVYPAKINSLWARARGQANLFPGSKSRERGFNALKGALGELYQIDIPYYIEVDFNGFKKIVDTFGGVAIDVQVPVVLEYLRRLSERATTSLCLSTCRRRGSSICSAVSG
jgi:LCP family protein required for cell wall assembly